MYKVRVFFIFVGICTFFRNFFQIIFFVTVHEKKMKQSAGWAY